MSRFLNGYYEQLKPYVPGEIPKESGLLKLNTNESPYPPSPGVLECFNRDAASLQRLYGDPANRELNRVLAGHYGLSADEVMATGGSDETLELAFMAYSPDGVAFADETYGFYGVFADLHHLDVKLIPLAEDFSIHPEDYYDLGREIILANPNAPTGLYLKREAIEEILRHNRDHVVVVDEAYVDFGNESMIPLIHQYENLLVIQTFSKSRSLAGARIGFAAGNSELIRDLERLRNSRNPYDISRQSQLAGVKAVEESSYYRRNCEKIIAAREWTVRELNQLGFHGPDSHTNFIFVSHEHLTGQEVYEGLRARGILVRHFDRERIKNYNRISIGTMEDMERLVAAMKEIVTNG